MRIYRMTATFGKLEHATITLEPGLNIITAPNEWGKSTWCAFLMAMLYGIDTRERSTKNALADKQRYAPWSGRPMSGRIDLNWQGRDITIERQSQGRIPLGQFRAYETASGTAVPELTADNCGQVLLGVEQGVFSRAGFIRQSQMPVTQDETLRRRLNALVTTGDDTQAMEQLGQSLKELKNRCRYNRSGLLPQAEAERESLKAKLQERQALEEKVERLNSQLTEIQSWLQQLYNHRQALAWQAFQENTEKAAQAKAQRDELLEQLTRQEQICQGLPPKEEAEQRIREIRAFREEWDALDREEQGLPPEPKTPAMPEPFVGMTEEEALVSVKRDVQKLKEAMDTRLPKVLLIIALLAGLACGGLLFLKAQIFAIAAGIACGGALAWGVAELVMSRRQLAQLKGKYGSLRFQQWEEPIALYRQQLARYQKDHKVYKDLTGDLEVRRMVLRKRREVLCPEFSPEQTQDNWMQVVAQWQTRHQLRQQVQQIQSHYETVKSLIRPAEPPAMEDHLSHTEADTNRLLSECSLEQQRMQIRLAQHQGRLDTLEPREHLELALERTVNRIASLEESYEALTIAIGTLAQARAELQRRFAPRITQRAQAFLEKLTGGKYKRMVMQEDFGLYSGADEEDVLRESVWRSEGTVDQLYLALRLAVAEFLTPEAPLILDDALVRFDDARLKAALALLQELAQKKQIICFTCQSRESRIQR